MVSEVSDWYELDNLRNNLEQDAILVNNLDSDTDGYDELASPTANGGKGWNPIGSIGSEFEGDFSGQDKTISDLYIDRPNAPRVGLFGIIDNISGQCFHNDITLENVDITGESEVGGYVGFFGENITVENITVRGSVSATNRAVGLFAGYAQDTLNDRSYVRNCYVEGSVDLSVNESGVGVAGVGGFFGTSSQAIVRDCISNVDVTTENLASDGGNKQIGGFAGGIDIGGADIQRCVAFGSVTAPDGVSVGGFIGASSRINKNCYSFVDVVGDENVGGYVGRLLESIEKLYVSNSVSGNTNVGALVGNNEGDDFLENGEINDSYWNTDENSLSAIGRDTGASSNLTGLTTSEMTGSTASSNMSLLDFTDTWTNVVSSDQDVSADSYPILQENNRKRQLILLGVAITQLDITAQDVDESQNILLIIGNEILENWSFNWQLVGTLIEEIREWSSLTLVFRYSDNDAGDVVSSMLNASGKVTVEEVTSGGFRGIDLFDGENTFLLNSPDSRDEVRPVDVWLLDNAEKETLNRDGNVFELELEFVPKKEKVFDNEYGTFGSEVNQSPSSSEWLFDFTFGSIATNKVEVGVTESNSGTLDVYDINMVLTPIQVRLFEENFGYLNKAKTREVPDGQDVVDDTSTDDRNTVDITQPDAASGPVSDGLYVCLDWETEWISGAYRVSWQVVRVEQ